MTTTDYECNGLEKILKLYTTQTTTNMHMFDEKEKLRKFESPQEIIDYYMDIRKSVYVERKKYLLAELDAQLVKLSNKAKYIMENLTGDVDLRRKKNDAIVALLTDRGYDMIDNSYNYLTKMPMDSVSEENVAKTLQEKGDKETELELLKATSEDQMWLTELDEFKEEHTKYCALREKEMMIDDNPKKGKSKKSGKRKIKLTPKK